jgi:hypothetical protein
MSALDIETPLGRLSVGWENEATDLWHRHTPNERLVTTNRTGPRAAAALDGVIVGAGDLLLGCYELKCRPRLTLDTLLNQYDGEWLITHRKIQDGIKTCKGLRVPLVGFLYLVAEKKLLAQTIWTPEDGLVVRMEVHNTVTQKTINGGQVERENAYIDITQARIISDIDRFCPVSPADKPWAAECCATPRGFVGGTCDYCDGVVQPEKTE